MRPGFNSKEKAAKAAFLLNYNLLPAFSQAFRQILL